jgi:hypothetical protein
MLNDWLCFFFGHKYRLAQELSPQSRRVCCKRCRKSFAMNDDTRILVDWDAEFHRMYERHGIEIKYQPWEYRKT